MKTKHLCISEQANAAVEKLVSARRRKGVPATKGGVVSELVLREAERAKE